MNLGLSLGLSQPGVIGSAASTLDDLVALLSGNSSVVDFTTATTGPFASTDLSGLANPWDTPAAGTAPGVSGTLGVTASGGTENVDYGYTSGTNTTIIYSAIYDPATTTQFVFSFNGASILIRAQSGSVSALPVAAGTVSVNDTVVTTRGEFFTEAMTNSEVVVKMTGLNTTATTLNLGRTSTSWDGSVRRCVVIDESSVTGGDLTSARSLAEAWVAES